MILKHKTAVVYGAGGSLGSTVAKAFADAGAKVFLTGLHIKKIQAVADEIIAAGGHAEAEEIDALNEQAVNSHIEKIKAKAGSIDISFNATGCNVVQNKPLVDISVDDFMEPPTLMLKTRFITALAAARVMMNQGNGVILSLTATPGGIGYPFTGGFAPACCSIESFARNLAGEIGVFGVRVVNIRSGGSPDSKVFKDAIDSHPAEMKAILHAMEGDTMLKKMPLMSDIANAALFLCSDMAGKITGVTIDVTSGTTAGLNYRVRADGSDITFGQPQ